MDRLSLLAAASAFLLTGAQAGPVDQQLEYTDYELYPAAIVVDVNHRYELTELSCAKEERLQRNANTASGRAYSRWLTQHSTAHPDTKAFTRYAGSTFDGTGCYERVSGGIRVYRPGVAPLIINAIVLPCDPQQTQFGTCAATAKRQPEAPPTTARPAMAARLVRTLLASPHARSAKPFLFESQPAVLWALTCKLASQMQMSEMEGADYPFLKWQASQSGSLITVERLDGTYSEACFEPTPGGIRVQSFSNSAAIEMTWN